MKRLVILPLLAAVSLLSKPAFAQSPIKIDGTFKCVKGVFYKIVKDVPGKTAEIGGGIEFNILAKCDTQTLGDSRAQNQGKPVSIPVTEVNQAAQFQSVFPFLSAGDSALIVIPCDTILKTVPPGQENNLPPWLKAGNSVTIYLSIVSVKTKEEMVKEQETQRKAQEEAAKMAKENAAKQVATDDKLLQDYLKKNKIKATKTASGLYYRVVKEGTGEKIKNGEKVSMRYTGKLLDGTTFDSNVGKDDGGKPKPEFTFPVGQHQVIPGWDEGVALLKKGTKAFFYIPSGLAYGEKGAGDKIGPNTCLMFEVDVVSVKTQAQSDKDAKAETGKQAATDDKMLKEYLAKNNIKATKTASGLYYKITAEGTGPQVKNGMTVSMNYTGKLLDGTPFDSNIDPQFSHVQPFKFPVGGHQVIAGWDEAIALFKKGTKATLFIPSGLAYGSRSAGPKIGPNSVLLFDVEVVDIVTGQ